MSVKTAVIVQGRVSKLASREVTVRKTGEKLTFTTALVIGDHTMADVQIGRDLGIPKLGDVITGRAVIGVFNNDDQLTLEAYIDNPKAA